MEDPVDRGAEQSRPGTATGDTPADIPPTSFSILFARYKGDLDEFVRGARAIDSLRDGDKVLIAEACSQHPIGEDIGRVRIPRRPTRYAGGKLEFDTVRGQDFPKVLSAYKLVVHCGACMWNRREMLSRVLHCRKAGVPPQLPNGDRLVAGDIRARAEPLSCGA